MPAPFPKALKNCFRDLKCLAASVLAAKLTNTDTLQHKVHILQQHLKILILGAPRSIVL